MHPQSLVGMVTESFVHMLLVGRMWRAVLP